MQTWALLRRDGGLTRDEVTVALTELLAPTNQGYGPFVGNVAMGLVFGWVYQKWGRTMPLVVAHTAIDVVAFVGYAALVGKVSWLPG